MYIYIYVYIYIYTRQVPLSTWSFYIVSNAMMVRSLSAIHDVCFPGGPGTAVASRRARTSAAGMGLRAVDCGYVLQEPHGRTAHGRRAWAHGAWAGTDSGALVANHLRVAQADKAVQNHRDGLAAEAAAATDFRVARENAVQNYGDRLAAEAAAASPGDSCDIDAVNKDEMWERVWQANGTVSFHHEGTGEVRAHLPRGIRRCFGTL